MEVSNSRSGVSRALHWAFLGLDISILALLFWRVVLVPENHWGIDNTVFPWAMLAQLVCLAVVRWVWDERGRLNALVAVVCALTLLASWLCVEMNLLLPYELWIQRGMP